MKRNDDFKNDAITHIKSKLLQDEFIVGHVGDTDITDDIITNITDRQVSFSEKNILEKAFDKIYDLSESSERIDLLNYILKDYGNDINKCYDILGWDNSVRENWNRWIANQKLLAIMNSELDNTSKTK